MNCEEEFVVSFALRRDFFARAPNCAARYIDALSYADSLDAMMMVVRRETRR